VLYSSYIKKLQAIIKVPLTEQQITKIRQVTGTYEEEMKVRAEDMRYLESKQDDIHALNKRMAEAGGKGDEINVRKAVAEHRALLAAGPAGKFDVETRKILNETQRKNWKKWEDDLDEKRVQNLLKAAKTAK
jgi:hypothetical protein